MGSKILIVEEHTDARESLTDQLRSLGYEIIEAADSHEAIEKALVERPDLIITDLADPGIDGVAATTVIRQNSETATIPVLAYTQWVSQLYKDSALKAGVTACLVKPASPQLLQSVIDTLC